jgi:uncharacterized protein (UPF0264 family)
MENKIKLLVSPKNIEEAKITINSGVDYIDCKNPKEGSLGANFPWIISKMKELIPKRGNQFLSATIGDFPNLPGSASLAALGAAYSGADIIKVGLKGPKNEKEGLNLMSKVVKSVKGFNKEIKIVAAGYADQKRLNTSPDFLSIPKIAAKSSSDIAMLDTLIKDGKGLFDFLTIDDLIKFKNKCKELNIQIAIAGNITIGDLDKIKRISPDIIGIRSAVCENHDREKGTIKSLLIKEFMKKLNN